MTFTFSGRCCASLEQPKALMKMGLSMVLVGHVNFLLGALVHGAVLRHINLNTRAHTVAYSISNIMALTTGLVGVVVGTLTILRSNNKKSRVLSMTLILWVPLIVICIVQLVLSVRCFSVCVSFLGLPCFPRKIRLRDHGRTMNTVAPAEPPSLTSSVPGHPLHLHLLQPDSPHLKSQRQPLPPPPLHHSDPPHLKSQRQPLPPPPPLHHSDPSHLKSQRQPLLPPPPLHHSDPSHLKSQRQPLPPPPLHHSDPPHLKSQRQPLPPPPLHHSDPSHLKSQRQPLRPPPPLHHSNPSHLKSQRQPLPPPPLHHSDPSHLKSQRQPLPPPPLHHSNPSHLKSQRQPLPPPLHHSNPSHLKFQRQPLPPPLHHSNPSHLKSQRQPLCPQHQNQRGSSDRWSDEGQLVPPEEHELLEQGFWI
ncbi:uncharacterized protein LOC135549499 isoform X4 [Oncorhynchus masou masou]|uniref:uncharacterized protein LOC135549499 isoform X4 n=1 Tax=Oncorhynchus masou masou TaxID=90313 RepID=UPI00318385F3